MRFVNKTAVVTGAAKGIGYAVAKRLHAEGAQVVLIDLGKEEVEAAAKKIDDKMERTKGIACDVADLVEVKKTFGEIERVFGKVDILVNNAGVTRDAMFHKMTEEQWDTVLDVNLGGVHNCTKAVIGGMRERNYGRIVNLASISAFGNIGQTNYGAAKAAVIGFTKCLARESARCNITVNAVAPSYINTEMLQAVPPQVMKKFIEAIPLNRLGEPEELAGAVAFLASDDASFVTGECLVVSGGSYM